MRKFELTIIASGLDPEADDFEDRLYEAGCDDATVSVQKGLIILEFTRDERNFVHALVSAIENVRAAGAAVERIEPDHLVSLSDIARRAGLSRAAVSLYVKGERASDFPAPVARVTTDSPLWDWVDVSRWMYRHEKLDLEAVLTAKTVREANMVVLNRNVEPAHFAKHLEDRAAELEAAL
ncbi:MAG: hypothetical protein C0481_02755 [Phenylobacterium sp.]|uniref:hypothetical protein n=1 Tax=Phenylobacterium sp. TaxID=1871053 RepID=UPI0025EF3E40|nr:hypothetical protein [Phenylobacterium sp.]MBA4010764.1 hypothetical protein [Phenylobacterium sp.]